MPDDRDTPGATQQLLSGAAAHVGHVSVVNREAKDPAEENQYEHQNPDCNWRELTSVNINFVFSVKIKQIGACTHTRYSRWRSSSWRYSKRWQSVPTAGTYSFLYRYVCVRTQFAHLSSSVHHRMSSLPFIRTGKCWSFPCLMELERVVIVRTFPNCEI